MDWIFWKGLLHVNNSHVAIERRSVTVFFVTPWLIMDSLLLFQRKINTIFLKSKHASLEHGKIQ
jgi:hypothetical protein